MQHIINPQQVDPNFVAYLSTLDFEEINRICIKEEVMFKKPDGLKQWNEFSRTHINSKDNLISIAHSVMSCAQSQLGFINPEEYPNRKLFEEYLYCVKGFYPGSKFYEPTIGAIKASWEFGEIFNFPL